jgi:drug/metabolite transporter (DMT)-like permease
VLTGVALLAFAGNSLLCRLALRHSAIDAASFTLIRLLSGALCLWLIARWCDGPRASAQAPAGNWLSALALFVYAAAFSSAYARLGAGTGALLLFGAVQASMIVWGLFQGERLRGLQWLGWGVAVAGLFGLVWPGWAAPPWQGSALMAAAGMAWAVYTVRGKRSGQGSPLRVTAGNFARAVLPAALCSALLWRGVALDAAGAACAVASGALASGVGYAVWYTVLPALRVTTAATLQLAVPVIAAAGGVVWLGEALTWRLVLSAPAILGGIALVVAGGRRR